MSGVIIKYGISTIEDGPMNLNCGLPPDIIQENQQTFFRKKGYGGLPSIQADLRQGVKVRVVDKSCASIAPEADGLIAADQDLILAVTAADCLPFWIFDKSQQVFGLVHAGWRGLSGGILAETVKKFLELGFHPADLIVSVGPHICADHFEIKADVLPAFQACPAAIIKKNGRIYADLYEFARSELLGLGCKPMRVSSSRECTYEQADKYYSFRRDKELPLKAQLAYIVKTDA